MGANLKIRMYRGSYRYRIATSDDRTCSGRIYCDYPRPSIAWSAGLGIVEAILMFFTLAVFAVVAYTSVTDEIASHSS